MTIRDLRKFARQTTTRLVMGVVVILFIVGEGLIYAIYGLPAAVSGLICLLGGLSPVLLIIGLLWVLDRIVKRNNQS
jgi:hypothetical protein